MRLCPETLIRAAAIGNFDGVHRGHRLLVDTLMREAGERRLFPSVFVLDRHPLELVDPGRAPSRLMSTEEKRDTLSALGPDVFTIRFDEATRRMTSMEYMTRLRDTFGVALLVVGYDNRFGSDRNSDADTYRRHGELLGMTVVEAPCLPGVSSSAIRKMISEGRIAESTAALGRPYRLTGTVEHGRGRGHLIGFPTANLRAADPRSAIPADGVYAAAATTADGGRYRAMVNVGTCPTFDEGERTVEASLLGFEGDIYDTRLSLEFADRLRDERRMPDAEALCRQLEADRESVASMPAELFQSV